MGWAEQAESADDKYIDRRRLDRYLCRLLRLLPYRDEKTTWNWGLFAFDGLVKGERAQRGERIKD